MYIGDHIHLHVSVYVNDVCALYMCYCVYMSVGMCVSLWGLRGGTNIAMFSSATWTKPSGLSFKAALWSWIREKLEEQVLGASLIETKWWAK